MYDAEQIQELAKKDMLVLELVKVLSNKTHKNLMVHSKSSPLDIAMTLGDNDVLITNNNYQSDCSNFYVIVNRYIFDKRYWLIKVDEDGQTINNYEIIDYINDLGICEDLSQRVNAIIQQCELVYLPVLE
jgi:hypothetical protein